MPETTTVMPNTVERVERLAARKSLLEQEKPLTRECHTISI
jgi:predicted dithiol-disulfide oxidoreductase (DUF899 family)